MTGLACVLQGNGQKKKKKKEAVLQMKRSRGCLNSAMLADRPSWCKHGMGGNRQVGKS